MRDPRLAEIARAVQRKHGGVLSPKSALEPATLLLAEFVYLGFAPKVMYEFVQEAGIEISYKGMCAWLRRHFGAGAASVGKAAALIQAAVNEGAFESAHFTSTLTLPLFPPSQAEGGEPSTAVKVAPPRNFYAVDGGTSALDASTSLQTTKVAPPRNSAEIAIDPALAHQAAEDPKVARPRNFDRLSEQNTSTTPSRDAVPAPSSTEVARPRNSTQEPKLELLQQISDAVARPRDLEVDPGPIDALPAMSPEVARPRNSLDQASPQLAPALDAKAAQKLLERQERHRILAEGMKKLDSPYQRMADEKRERENQLELERSKK